MMVTQAEKDELRNDMKIADYEDQQHKEKLGNDLDYAFEHIVDTDTVEEFVYQMNKWRDKLEEAGWQLTKKEFLEWIEL